LSPQDVVLALSVAGVLASVARAMEERFKAGNLTGYIALFGIALALALTLELELGTYRTGSGMPVPSVEFKVDTLSKSLAVLFLGVFLAAVVHSFSYMRESTVGAYYTLLVLMAAGLTGAVFSNDLFTFYCFWELASVSGYALVGYRWWHWEPVEAAFKYLLACTVGALTTLYAASLLYGFAGTTNFDELRIVFKNSGNSQVVAAIAALLIVGLGTTAAVVPFHTWLPDAHPAAPSPVSALLSGVIVNIPLYVLARLLLVVLPQLSGVGYALLLLGAFSCFVGNAAALVQLDAKRFLAYSTIANVGYMLVGVGACYRALAAGAAEVAASALTGAFVHLVNHSLGKSLLFLCLGNAIQASGSRLFTSLEGYGRRMPFTGAFSLVALLNLAGIPPMVGYYGKAFITAGLAYKLGDPVALIVLAVLEVNFALAAGYYAYFAYRVFRGRGYAAKDAPLPMLLSEAALAAVIVAMSIYPGFLVEGVHASAQALLGKP
jgi:formate hydrogenlyase subunit 3/multisubunit Na+/H+ antiporter MnhD subunit